jgi:hypothetical protein
MRSLDLPELDFKDMLRPEPEPVEEEVVVEEVVEVVPEVVPEPPKEKTEFEKMQDRLGALPKMELKQLEFK